MRLSADVYHRIMQSLRADLPDMRGRDKRNEPRAGVSGRAEVVLPGASQRRPHNLAVRDLSRGGIGILSPDPVEIGEQFLVVLPADSSGPPRSLVFRVAYCRHISRELFAIGGELVRLIVAAGTAGDAPVTGSAIRHVRETRKEFRHA